MFDEEEFEQSDAETDDDDDDEASADEQNLVVSSFHASLCVTCALDANKLAALASRDDSRECQLMLNSSLKVGCFSIVPKVWVV